MMKLFAVGALIALTPGVARASQAFDDSTFSQCDGYGAPGRSDGYLTGTLFAGLVTTKSDVRPVGTSVIGAFAVKVCDDALVNPLLKPEFTYRRSHLMLAKAVHLIVAGRPADALAVLDQEQAGPGVVNDAFRARGFGIANDEVRALALVALGRKDEALARLHAIEVARPFAIANRDFARRVSFRVDSSYGAYLAGIRAIAPIDPGSISQAMVVALELGQFDDVIALGSGLTFAVPRMKGDWKLDRGATTEYDMIAYHARIEGMLAYAETARGHADAGAARLDALEAAIVTNALPPADAAPGQAWPRDVSSDYLHRIAGSGSAKRVLDDWRAAIALRRAAPTLTGAQFIARQKLLSQDVASLVWLDGIVQVTRPTAAEDYAIVQAVAAGHVRIMAALSKQMAIDYAQVIANLPKAETAGDQPHLHKAGDGNFISDNGYSSREMGVPGEWTVRFTSQLGTIASIEEQAFYGIANLAQGKGSDRFLIETRREVARTTHVIQYGRVIRDENSGHEVQFAVRLLPSGATPVDIAGVQWRVLDPKQVLAALGEPAAKAQ